VTVSHPKWDGKSLLFHQPNLPPMPYIASANSVRRNLIFTVYIPACRWRHTTLHWCEINYCIMARATAYSHAGSRWVFRWDWVADIELRGANSVSQSSHSSTQFPSYILAHWSWWMNLLRQKDRRTNRQTTYGGNNITTVPICTTNKKGWWKFIDAYPKYHQAHRRTFAMGENLTPALGPTWSSPSH